MLVPLFRADNSVKTFVAIVDVSLQEAAFAGNLPTSAGVYVLISLVFGQAFEVQLTALHRTSAVDRLVARKVEDSEISGATGAHYNKCLAAGKLRHCSNQNSFWLLT